MEDESRATTLCSPDPHSPQHRPRQAFPCSSGHEITSTRITAWIGSEPFSTRFPTISSQPHLLSPSPPPTSSVPLAGSLRHGFHPCFAFSPPARRPLLLQPLGPKRMEGASLEGNQKEKIIQGFVVSIARYPYPAQHRQRSRPLIILPHPCAFFLSRSMKRSPGFSLSPPRPSPTPSHHPLPIPAVLLTPGEEETEKQ